MEDLAVDDGVGVASGGRSDRVASAAEGALGRIGVGRCCVHEDQVGLGLPLEIDDDRRLIERGRIGFERLGAGDPAADQHQKQARQGAEHNEPDGSV